MIRRRAHTRRDPRTGRQVRVRAHNVEGSARALAGDRVALSTAARDAAYAQAVEEARMSMLDTHTPPSASAAPTDLRSELQDAIRGQNRTWFRAGPAPDGATCDDCAWFNDLPDCPATTTTIDGDHRCDDCHGRFVDGVLSGGIEWDPTDD